ncbi:MAG TPA: glycosyltransferase family 4 protein [Euzebyales bacterium]|nr:glycosyltransferase family 4 protein [Euzebyales bacterium]
MAPRSGDRTYTVIIRYLIANAYGAGGTIKTTLNMAGHLAAEHDVEVISVFRHRQRPAFAFDPAVTVRVLTDMTVEPAVESGPLAAAGRSLRAWAQHRPSRLIDSNDRRYDRFSLLTDARLLQFLRSLRDGVLVSTRPGLNLAVARFVRPSVVRVGQEHMHLSRHHRHRPKLYRAIGAQYGRLDALTTLTNADADDYRALLGQTTRTVAIPNAVPPSGVRAALDNKVVVAAGRLTGQKGFDRLILAFRQVADRRPDWQLRIFGKGESEAALQALIDDLDLADTVKLMGFTKRLPREMGDASIYAMSSRFEGFPMVLLEAMACGLPPVSFDCPTGPRDLIDHGVDGLLAPDGDIAALAARLLDLIDDDARRHAMGAAALEKSRQFTPDAIARRWVELFAALTADKGVATASHR